MANKVTFGFKNVHIAFADGESGTQSAWKTPVAIPGAVRWTPAAEGESNTFYADDGPYFVSASNNGYTGELEMALVPDAILAEMLGWEIDNNGTLVEIADGVPKKFALIGEVDGDSKNRRFVYYDCQASRPAKEHNTKGETTEPATDVLNLTISPVKIGDKMIVKGVMELDDTNKTQFDSFFSAVYVPSFGAGV